MFDYIRHRLHPLWRLRQMAWYRWLQKRMDFTIPLRCGRIRFRVRLLRDFSLVVPHGGGEVATRKTFAAIIRGLAITHLFDIGANVGTFSWPAINLTPDLEVFLFEPDLVNIKLLKETINENQLGRVHLWEGVVDRQAGEVEFTLDPASGAAGSIKDFSANVTSLQVQYGMSRRRKVRATTLDSYLELPNSNGARIFLKIDVEGAEGDVLEGGRAFMQKFRPVMIVECFETKSLEPVRGMDYSAFDLRENGNVLLVPREWVTTLMDLKIISRETPVPAGW